MTSKQCRTFLISDSPSKTDNFNSHQRLADAIAELILSEKDGGKTIGIEGEWGSGKSTIINLIQDKLESKDSENILVFSFDAWAHHDDPLRRTFLESLMAQIEKKGWINERDKDSWIKRRAVIAQKLKIDRTVTHTNLKTWAKWLVISTFAMPVGVALLTSGFDAVTLVKDLFSWKVYLGLICSFLPIFILGLVLLKDKVEHTSDIESDKKSKENELKSDPWTLLVQDTHTDLNTETYQTPNPTSIEFEDTFSDLMQAIAKKKQKASNYFR
jgi:hypothetical protein